MKAETRDQVLRALFHEARTHNGWLDQPVDAACLRQLYDAARMAPTAMNCQPMRLVFLTTAAARERLVPALSAGNVDKTRSAPVTVIVAYDSRFYDSLHKTWHNPAAREQYAANPPLAAATALRNSSIQGGFLMLAARALGLDCGPMSGFDADKVDAEFFGTGRWRCNFLCNLGYGDAAQLMPRQRRLSFDEACQLL